MENIQVQRKFWVADYDATDVKFHQHDPLKYIAGTIHIDIRSNGDMSDFITDGKLNQKFYDMMFATYTKDIEL